MYKEKIGIAVFVSMVVGGLCILSTPTFAEGPAISGFIDTTYNYNFLKPLSGTTALRSYDAKDNNIALNAAHLEFMGTLENVTYNVQLDAGSDALVNTSAGGGDGDDFDIQEAYLAYVNPNIKLGYKVGKFATFMGIEVIEGKDNPTVSRGYLFGLAEPFTHTGGVVTYQIGKFDLAAGAVNGFDILTDNNDSKTAVGKVTANYGDPLTITLSAAHGSEQVSDQIDDDDATLYDDRENNNGHLRSTVDLTGVTKILPKLALWFQGLYGQEEDIGTVSLATWRGVGIQPVYSLSDKFSIGARVEYFEDSDGVKTGTVGSANPSTYTTNYTIAPVYKVTSNTAIRLEYRYDSANQELWEDDKGNGRSYVQTFTTEFYVTF